MSVPIFRLDIWNKRMGEKTAHLVDIIWHHRWVIVTLHQTVWQVSWTHNTSSQNSLLTSQLRFKALSSKLVQQMTVLWRCRFWEYLPLLACVAGCSWPLVLAFLFSGKKPPQKTGGDRAKRRMSSQQESCCGLAFTGLNGLKLIWNSALSLSAWEFSHIKPPVVSPPDWNENFFLIWLLAVWNFTFRLSSGFKAFAKNVSYCRCELILK